MSGETKQKVADALEQFLGDIWESARPPEPSNVGPATIDENGRITIPFTVSFEMFCTMVGNLYRMGETHEYVTSWIEQHMPDFREYFIEIHLSGGSKMWARKPDQIVLTVDVGETI